MSRCKFDILQCNPGWRAADTREQTPGKSVTYDDRDVALEETAIMEKSEAISNWIKSNPLIVSAGALTTVLGLVISLSNVVPVILKALNRPDCFP